MTEGSGSSLTLTGAWQTATVGNSSSLAVTDTANTDTIHLGTGDTVSGNGGAGLYIGVGSSLTLYANPSALDVIANPGTGITSPGTTPSQNTINVTGGGAIVVGSYDTLTFAGTGNVVDVYSGSVGHDTIHANNSTIMLVGTSAAILATDTVVGTGDTVTRDVASGGGGGGGGGKIVHGAGMLQPAVVPTAASALIQAMALYAPESAVETSVPLHPYGIDGLSLSTSSYSHQTV